MFPGQALPLIPFLQIKQAFRFCVIFMTRTVTKIISLPGVFIVLAKTASSQGQIIYMGLKVLI